MADLPEVVLKEIFDFLGIRERLRVRSMCKRWKFVIDTLSHQRNVCIHSASCPYKERWCFSDQRVTEGEMVHLKFDPETRRPFDLRMQFFGNLEKVYLYYLMDKVDLFLDEIKHLTRLKVLMIEEETIQPRTLNSPSLEMLSLRGYNLGHFQLNTPSLSSLVLCNIRHLDSPWVISPAILKFCSPLKVKHLQCTEFTENLGQLKNLETLVCIEIPFEFRLNEFKSLTKAELWSVDAFRTVQDQKKRLNRTNLKVLASGFDAERVEVEPFETQHQFFCNPLTPIEKGKLVLSLSFLEKVESNQWKLAGIPRVFFHKFRIDRILYADRDATKKEQPTLLELVEKCNPKEFMTFRYWLNRYGLERLSRIQSIHNMHGICDIESADFLLNLKYLESLQIYSPKISIQFICSLFKELEFFFHLYFHSSESSGFHLHIGYHNYPPESRVADGFAADALYTLHYHCGPIGPTGDLGVKKGMDFKNLDELIEGVKGMREDEIVKSFFV